MSGCLALASLIALLPAQDSSPTRRVREVLHELKSTQGEDGRWKAPEKSPEGLTDEGMTGLALLVFAGAGNTHRHGEYMETAKKGLAYLADSLDDSGRVQGSIANQAVVTMALAELYAVTRDFKYKKAAAQTGKALLDEQHPDGGFGDSETGSIYATTLALMGMAACRVGNLKLEVEPHQERARDWLEDQVDPETLHIKGKTDPLGADGAAAAIYVGRRFSRLGAGTPKEEDPLRESLGSHLVKVEYRPEMPRDAFFLAYALLFLENTFAWKGCIAIQESWLAEGKRSDDAAGRLFETLALQVRVRYERLQKARR